MLDILTISAFLFIALAMFALGQLVVGRQRNQLEDGDRPRPRSATFGIFTPALAGVLPAGNAEGLTKDLRRAGYYHKLALQDYLAIRNVLLVGWVLLVATAIAVLYEPEADLTVRFLVGGAIVGIILLTLPRLILQTQAGARLQRIQYALPDAVDMITMTMTGGMPLQQALSRVTGEIGATYPDLACELTIITRHTQAGTSERAFQQFAERIDIPDVQSLAALVGQTERLGSNVLTALRDFSDGVRRGQRQRAEEQGNKATIKLLFPIVFCLAPSVYILLLGPAMLELRKFVDEQGRPGGAFSQTEAVIPEATLNPRRQTGQNPTTVSQP